MAYTKGMIGQLYIKFGAEPFTYQEAGIHYATLNAAAKRGWLIKNGSQYQVTQRGLIFTRIEQLASGHEFISLRKNNATVGMLCIVNGMDLLDAWYKPYDVIDVVEYRFRDMEWNKIFPNK